MKALIFGFLIAVSAQSYADIKPLNAIEFEQLMKSGAGVIIAAHAPWCPTCRAQKPILKELSSQSKYQALTIYEVDFDSQKTFLSSLNIQRQSTLVAFKQGKEIARSLGSTNSSVIESVLKAAE